MPVAKYESGNGDVLRVPVKGSPDIVLRDGVEQEVTDNQAKALKGKAVQEAHNVSVGAAATKSEGEGS